jgi:integrase
MPKLTDKLLRGLKAPTSGQVDYWDELLPSFGVRIGTTGRKSFIVGARIKGRYTRFTLKPAFPHLSLAEARLRAKQIFADAQAGIGPEVRKKRDERGTFGAVAADFMASHGVKLRTSKQIQRMIDVDLTEWHDRQITEIKRADIKGLIRQKAQTAPIAANRLLALISKIFNWALKEDLIEASPAMMIDRPGKETERERSLSADEIKSIWGAFDRYPWGPLFKMLLITGQRCGEVGGMKWSEVTEDGWRIPNERAKRGKGHLVPLSSLAREVLADIPQMGEYVFRWRNDKPLQGWSNAKERVDKIATIAHWRLHDLRRTFATHLRSLGIDRLIVSKLLNHAEGGVTKIYDRWAADPEKTAAMERWASRLREIIAVQDFTPLAGQVHG